MRRFSWVSLFFFVSWGVSFTFGLRGVGGGVRRLENGEKRRKNGRGKNRKYKFADCGVAENDITGESLVALLHEDLKQMGIASVGHRLTILKSVYEIKVKQDVMIESDHYVPLCKFKANST